MPTVDVRKYLAELLGTFLFMTIGYLSIPAFHAAQDPTGLHVVPFSFGFGLLAAIFAFGHISGGHFNPAVSVAIALDRRMKPVDAGAYIVAQIIGALLAAGLVLVLFDQQAVAEGITAPGTGVSDISALGIETALTAGFLVVILTATRHSAQLAAVAIPLTLLALHFAAATLSGASFNPARSIGSAVVGGDVSKLWIYLIAPTLGGIIGWAVYRGLNPTDTATE